MTMQDTPAPDVVLAVRHECDVVTYAVWHHADRSLLLISWHPGGLDQPPDTIISATATFDCDWNGDLTYVTVNVNPLSLLDRRSWVCGVSQAARWSLDLLRGETGMEWLPVRDGDDVRIELEVTSTPALEFLLGAEHSTRSAQPAVTTGGPLR